MWWVGDDHRSDGRTKAQLSQLLIDCISSLVTHEEQRLEARAETAIKALRQANTTFVLVKRNIANTGLQRGLRE